MHDQDAIASAFLGWGASTWVKSGFRYYLCAGEACVAFVTAEGDTGTEPTGFDYDHFDIGTYGDECDPDESQGIPDPEAQISVTFAGWIWWGPRNRYYWRFRDGIGKSPQMICGEADPENDPMFCFDPDDGSTVLVLYRGNEP